MGQSSNDVIPTAIAVSSAINIIYELFPKLDKLSQSLQNKQAEVGHIVKTGRTHLMDAMPVSFAQTLAAWQLQVDHAMAGIRQALERVCELAQGGTAVGTGINADPAFAGEFCQHLSENVGIRFSPSKTSFIT